MFQLQGDCVCWRELIAEKVFQTVLVLQLVLPCVLLAPLDLLPTDGSVMC